MGWPKQPGQDEQAHRELAERHLAVVQELAQVRKERDEALAAIGGHNSELLRRSTTGTTGADPVGAVERAENELARCCANGFKLRASIPAQETDSDLVISAGLQAVRALAQERDALREERAEMLKTLEIPAYIREPFMRERDEARARCGELEALCKTAADVLDNLGGHRASVDSACECCRVLARLRAAAEKERGA